MLRRMQAFVPSLSLRMHGNSARPTPRGGRGRGRGRGRGGFKREKGRYKGAGVPLTRVERGYKYFKKSFVENPWEALERVGRETVQQIGTDESERVNPEEIDIDLGDANESGKM